MVLFKKDRFIVEVEVESNPAQTWKKTFSEMLEILKNDGFDDNYSRSIYIDFLMEMLPADDEVEMIDEFTSDEIIMHQFKVFKAKEKVEESYENLRRLSNEKQ